MEVEGCGLEVFRVEVVRWLEGGLEVEGYGFGVRKSRRTGALAM